MRNKENYRTGQYNTLLGFILLLNAQQAEGVFSWIIGMLAAILLFGGFIMQWSNKK